MEQMPQERKESGLEAGIETMREKISGLTSMVDQIEKLQHVPSGYSDIGEKVGSDHLAALDQFGEYRESYDAKLEKSEQALSEAYQAILGQLNLLRSMTGVHTEEEAMKFDASTGRQEKDS